MAARILPNLRDTIPLLTRIQAHNLRCIQLCPICGQAETDTAQQTMLRTQLPMTRFTKREMVLVHAAAEALYYLKQLEDINSFGEHPESQQVAIDNLEAALNSYKIKGIHYSTYN